MMKKRLTIGARVRHKKNGDCDGVIKSILGRGKSCSSGQIRKRKRKLIVEACFALQKSKKKNIFHQTIRREGRRP